MIVSVTFEASLQMYMIAVDIWAAQEGRSRSNSIVFFRKVINFPLYTYVSNMFDKLQETF